MAAFSSFAEQIFDYMRDGEELVEEPFQRLIEDDQLLAFRHEGFWRPMDTLKDKEVLEDLVEQGRMPWRIDAAPPAAASTSRAGRPDEIGRRSAAAVYAWPRRPKRLRFDPQRLVTAERPRVYAEGVTAMRVLVTGHLGYIGTVMVPMLLKAGHHVIGFDSNLYERCTFRRRRQPRDGAAYPQGCARRHQETTSEALTPSFTSQRCPTTRSAT